MAPRGIVILVTIVHYFSRTLVEVGAADLCRFGVTYQTSFSRAQFNSIACWQCFNFIYAPAYHQNYIFYPCEHGLLICDKQLLSTDATGCNCNNSAVVFNLADFSSDNSSVTPFDNLVLSPSLPGEYLELTRLCCEEAKRCCDEVLRWKEDRTPWHHCPATWDGWQCWDVAESNSTLTGDCPLYSYGRYSDKDKTGLHSSKRCLSKGEWFSVDGGPKGGVEWTNYTSCAANVEKGYVKVFVTVGSFAVSVISIIPAIIILTKYRLLKMTDVFILHRQLLISFLLMGTIVIFNIFFFIIAGGWGEQLRTQNHLICRIMFTVQLRYLRLANYTWMLCEGWYLHFLLVRTFSEHKMIYYYLFGWGFPLIPTVAYSVLRSVYEEREPCWIQTSKRAWIEWVYMAPCLVALCLNLLLMVIILYILIRKLRDTPDSSQPQQYRKMVRATIILLPVFGCHFFITIYRTTVFAYEIFNLLLDGLQGFLVALIICYTNERVLELLRGSWKRRRDKLAVQRQTELTSRVYHGGSVAYEPGTKLLELSSSATSRRP